MQYEGFFKAAKGKMTHNEATVIYNESEFLAVLNILKRKGIITDKEYRKELGDVLQKYADEIKKM